MSALPLLFLPTLIGRDSSTGTAEAPVDLWTRLREPSSAATPKRPTQETQGSPGARVHRKACKVHVSTRPLCRDIGTFPKHTSRTSRRKRCIRDTHLSLSFRVLNLGEMLRETLRDGWILEGKVVTRMEQGLDCKN